MTPARPHSALASVADGFYFPAMDRNGAERDELNQQFPALLEHASWLAHGFVTRIPNLDVNAERSVVLQRLSQHHAAAVEALGFSPGDLATAEQVHGADVAAVSAATGSSPAPGADGLATDTPGKLLGIHVADCAAVYLVDPAKRAVALVHSGKKGTEAGIARVALHLLISRYGTSPSDVVAQLAPCIRPPHYEIDFAADIRRQLRDAGVPPGQIHDPGTCTASNLQLYYSYRAEKGRTGRMLALLGLRQQNSL